MRRTAAILVITVAAVMAVSCASSPSQKDTQSSPTSASKAAPASEPAKSTPVEDSLSPGQAAQVAQDQPSDASLGLPAAPPAVPAPQAHPAPQVESVQTTDTSNPEKFPLSTPKPPSSAKAQAGEKSAARPAQSASKPQASAAQQQASAAQPRAASAQTATAPQGGAAQTAPQPQAAGAQSAAQTSASSDGASSSASTYGRLREIYAREGDDVQIGLDGPGFLFLGFPDRNPNGEGMSFKGKDTRDGKTWFSFKAIKLGTYDLDFLRQDNSTGTSSKETVRVHVVSDADFAAATTQGQQQTPASGEAPGDPAFAAKLASLGQYDAAIAELLKGYRDGNPGLNDSIARLYLRTGAYEAAGKYFTKNLAEQGQYGDSAVLGLTTVAIAQKDQLELLSLLKRLLAVKDPGLEETLVAVARLERDKREVGLGIDLAGEYLSRYSNGTWRDEADFILAQLLELDSQFRDIARARATYKEILDRFPESLFAARARERIGYIDRHFFEIR